MTSKFFLVPDMEEFMHDPLTRRTWDMYMSLRDFIGPDFEALRPVVDVSDTRYSMLFEGDCGYSLKLATIRGIDFGRVDFTLIQEEGYSNHEPVMRFARLLSRRDWAGLHLNMDYDTDQLNRLSRELGFTRKKYRAFFDDRTANAAFAGACNLFWTGFAESH